MEVEVDDGPQGVSDPGAIVLFGFDQPLRIFEKDIRAERRAVCDSLKATDPKIATCLRTSCGGTDASLGVGDHVDLEVEHGLLETACEYVSGKTGHLLRPCQRVDDVVHLRAKARGVEHGELVNPGEVDVASPAQPVDGVFGDIRIGY